MQPYWLKSKEYVKIVTIMDNKLKQLRLEHGYTIRSLAEALTESGLKITSMTISRYERGEREPKLATWQKLADFFNVTVPYIQGTSEITLEQYGEWVDLFNQYSENKAKIGNEMLQRFVPNSSPLENEIHAGQYVSLIAQLGALIYSADVLKDKKANKAFDDVFDLLYDALADLNNRKIYTDLTPDDL